MLSDAELCAVELRKLQDSDLRTWRAALPPSVKDPETKRETGLKATTQRRLINDLKAALNDAATKHRKTLPTTVTAEIKAGLEIAKGTASSVARDPQILTDEKVAAVLKAASEIDPDLHRLVLVLAATGLRFSQVVRCRVRDLTPTALVVPRSRKGSGSDDRSPIVSPISTATYEALRSNREPDAPLLERWRHVQTGPRTWERRDRGPWMTASEIARPWADIRKRAELGESIVVYALRHTSIVRRIKAGLPILAVAQLHDTSPSQIEKHYGAHINHAIRDAIAATAL